MLIILILTLLIIGFCIPVYKDIKEALIVVFFVALTELIFLRLIASRYISVNPQEIQKELGIAIKKWIKLNNKILN